MSKQRQDEYKCPLEVTESSSIQMIQSNSKLHIVFFY